MMENFADIEGPLRIGLLGLVLLAAGILVLTAVLGYVVLRLSRRRPKAVEGSEGLRRSPLEIALERLQQLRTGMAGLEAESFTVEVVDVVRDYLESALKIPAREQTSEEFMLALQDRSDLPPVLDESMPAFLEQCDRVKFARQSLADNQRDGLLQTAETVVESTDHHLRAPLNPEETSPATV